jgi:uroporphyrinogen decarboxylase
MQNSRERVKAAVNRQHSDQIPKGELCIGDDLVGEIMRCGTVGFEERAAFAGELGLDLVCLAPDYPAGKSIPERLDDAIPDLGKWVAETPLFTFALLDGAFGWGMQTLGYADFLTLPQRSPASLQELLERVERLNIDLIKRLIGRGIDGIILAEDIAYQRGLLVNPQILREYFFPSLTGQVREAAAHVPVFFHSDGNYAEVIPDLIRCGFRGLQCFERSAGMAPLQLREQYPELCVWGTMEVADLEQADNPVHLDKLLSEIHALASGGGFILGTTCGLFQGINLNGLAAIYNRL